MWTQQRIEPVTRSYSMIFLIIRSLCWTASNFQSTRRGSQVSEMRASGSGRRGVLNVNVNYEEMFQYLNLLAVSCDSELKIQVILQVPAKTLLTAESGRWFTAPCVAYGAVFPSGHTFIWRWLKIGTILALKFFTPKSKLPPIIFMHPDCFGERNEMLEIVWI